MIVESRPWVLGQSLTHTNGLLYVATGTGSYKAAAPEEFVVEVEPIRQEHFYPGDVLPDWMIESVQVCLVDGTLVDVYDTEQLPDDVNGMVIVDAVTGMPTFNQKPVKLEDQRQTVYGVGDTLPEWMVGKVNVCLLVTGEVVELCDDEAVPDDIDGTVIVDALTGVPTYNQGAQKPVPVVKPIASQLDEPTKEDVESGVCIWRNQSDGCLYTVTVEDDGSCTWFSSDKNDTNTFATVIEAPAAGVDDYGNQYSASQDLIVFADDSIMAMAVDTDTVDGYSEQGESDGSQLDAEGNPIPAGNKITTYYDATGAVVNSRDDEKTQGSTTTPSADGLGQVITTSDNETTYVADAQLTGPVLNTTTGMLEMLDQDGNVSGEPWFPVSPKNQTKISLAPADGQVLDGNGVAVAATTISGQPIVAGDRVIVECDPDTGAVIQVMTNALPKDCVLSINGQAPDALGDFDISADTVVDNGDLTYTVTPGDGSDPFSIDAKCKQFIDFKIEPCPLVYPLCGVTADTSVEITDQVSGQTFLDDNFGAGLRFDEQDCRIYGCIDASVVFDLELTPSAATSIFSVLAGTVSISRIDTSDGSDVSVTWPDGTTVSVASQDGASGGVQPGGDVEITVAGCACISRFEISGPWSFDIASLNQSRCLIRFIGGNGNVTIGDICDLPDTLEVYGNTGSNTTTGDIGCLPLSLTTYNNAGQNTTSGDIADLPATLSFYGNSGQNTTTGNLVNLPTGLAYYSNGGQNTTSGLLADLPAGVATYINSGQNTTTGDIADLPAGMRFYSNSGSNTTSGDIEDLPSSTTVFINNGQNTTTGDIADLPAGMTYYSNAGQNTTTGDIGDLPTGLTHYTNIGQNTTTGDIASLPLLLEYYNNSGLNTTNGDLVNLPASVNYYGNGGQSTVSISSAFSPPSPFRRFLSTSTLGHTTAEIDLILESLANITSWASEKDVFLDSANAAPSAAGSAFIPVILANGASQVVTN